MAAKKQHRSQAESDGRYSLISRATSKKNERDAVISQGGKRVSMVKLLTIPAQNTGDLKDSAGSDDFASVVPRYVRVT